MVLINKGETNTIILTLTEKVTITDPYYLMVLDGKSGQDVVKWLMTDISAYPEHYNKFTFIEGTTATIPYKGDYIYKAYQKATADLTIPSEANLLETGILRMYATEPTIEEYLNPTDTEIYEANN
jgi:hypothetical protein